MKIERDRRRKIERLRERERELKRGLKRYVRSIKGVLMYICYRYF